MSGLTEIKAPIEDEMRKFEPWFRDSMKSSVPLLNKITHYIVKRKGKQMRPMFVFLSAKVFETPGDSTYVAASLIELLHTATLVHDDVVDDAYKRRGFFSLNSLWKNKIAVLVGDFLLSKGLLLSIDNDEFGLLKIVSTAVREMSEGELLQIEKARRLDIEEDIYYEIIRQKTASLIAACCASGAESVRQPQEVIDKMYEFGLATGMAFQIKDDLFDYGEGGNIGKPTGIDIKEQKMTLPLIFALNNVEKKDKRFMINVVKNHNTDKEKVNQVIKMVIDSGGIDYATKKMHEYRDQALDTLKEMPDCPARTSLEQLVLFTTERNK